MNDATPARQALNMQPLPVQPFAVWNSVRGAWEDPQHNLFGRQEPFWETWPISGWMRRGWACRLPLSELRIPGSGYSSSRGGLLRTPLASDSARGGETLEQVQARRGTIALSHQLIDLATRAHRIQTSGEGAFRLVEEFLCHGDDTRMQSPSGNG